MKFIDFFCEELLVAAVVVVVSSFCPKFSVCHASFEYFSIFSNELHWTLKHTLSKIATIVFVMRLCNFVFLTELSVTWTGGQQEAKVHGKGAHFGGFRKELL